ncbi:MAG: hypothetical protein ABH859_01420 [Pseudomonadota bacterium]
MFSGGESRLEFFCRPNELLAHLEQSPPGIRSGPIMARPASIDQSHFEERLLNQLEHFEHQINYTNSIIQLYSRNPNHSVNQPNQQNQQENQINLEESIANFESGLTNLQLAMVTENQEEFAQAVSLVFASGAIVHNIRGSYQDLQDARRRLREKQTELEQARADLVRERRNDMMSSFYADGFNMTQGDSFETQLRTRISTLESQHTEIEREIEQLEDRFTENILALEEDIFEEIFEDFNPDPELRQQYRQDLPLQYATTFADALRAIRATHIAREYYEAAIDNAPNVTIGLWYQLQAYQMDMESQDASLVTLAIGEVADIRSNLDELRLISRSSGEIMELVQELQVFVEDQDPEGAFQALEQLQIYLRSLENEAVDPDTILNILQFIEQAQEAGQIEQLTYELQMFAQQLQVMIGDPQMIEEIDALALHLQYGGTLFARYAQENLSEAQTDLLDNQQRALEDTLVERMRTRANLASDLEARLWGQMLDQMMSLYTARGAVRSDGMRESGGIIAQLHAEHDDEGIEDVFQRLGNAILFYEDIIQNHITEEPNDPLYSLYAGVVTKLFVNGVRAVNRQQDALRNLRYLNDPSSADLVEDRGVLLAFNQATRDLPSKSAGLGPDSRLVRQDRTISDGHFYIDDDRSEPEPNVNPPEVPSNFDIRRLNLHLINGGGVGPGIAHTQLLQNINQNIREEQPHLFDDDGELLPDVDFTGTARGDDAYWRTLSDYLISNDFWQFGLPALASAVCMAALPESWTGVGTFVAAGACGTAVFLGRSGVNIAMNYDTIRQSEITGMSEITEEQEFRNWVTFGVTTSVNAVINGRFVGPIGRGMRQFFGASIYNIGNGYRVWLAANEGSLATALNPVGALRGMGAVGGEVASWYRALPLNQQILYGLNAGEIVAGGSLYGAGHYVDGDTGFYLRQSGLALSLAGLAHVPLRAVIAEETLTAMNASAGGWANFAVLAGTNIYMADRYLIVPDENGFLSTDFVGTVNGLPFPDHINGLGLIQPPRGPNEQPRIGADTWVGTAGVLLAGGAFLRYDFPNMSFGQQMFLPAGALGVGLDWASDGEVNSLLGGASGSVAISILAGRLTGVSSAGMIWYLPIKIANEVLMQWQAGRPITGPDPGRIWSFSVETIGISIPIMWILRGNNFLGGFALGRNILRVANRIPVLRNMPSMINIGQLPGLGGAGIALNNVGARRLFPDKWIRSGLGNPGSRTYTVDRGGRSSDVLRINDNPRIPQQRYSLNGRYLTEAELVEQGYVLRNSVLYQLEPRFQSEIQIAGRNITPREYRGMTGPARERADQMIRDQGWTVNGDRFVRASLENLQRLEILENASLGELNTPIYRTFQVRIGGRLNGRMVWVRAHASSSENVGTLNLGGYRNTVSTGRTLATQQFRPISSLISAAILGPTVWLTQNHVFRKTCSGDEEYQPMQRVLNYLTAILVIWPYIQSPLGYDTGRARVICGLLGIPVIMGAAALFPPYRDRIPGFGSFVNELGEDDWEEASAILHSMGTSYNLLDFYGQTVGNNREYEEPAYSTTVEAIDYLMALSNGVDASQAARQHRVPDDVRVMLNSMNEELHGNMGDILSSYARGVRLTLEEIRRNETTTTDQLRFAGFQAAIIRYIVNNHESIGGSFVEECQQIIDDYPVLFERIPESLDSQEERDNFFIELNGSGARITRETIIANRRRLSPPVDPDDSSLHPIIRDMRQR